MLTKGSEKSSVYVHPTAILEDGAQVGEGTKIWAFSQVRKGSRIGKNCILSKGVYVDAGAVVGDLVKIQNNVSVYQGVTIEDGVFVGPHVCFTNDMRPRGINPDGTLKAATDWTVATTRISYGAALGANATVVCGITIGRWAMVGSGSVITRDVPAFGLVVGNPARLIGYVSPSGDPMAQVAPNRFFCRTTNKHYDANGYEIP